MFVVELELRIPDIEVDEHFWLQNGISRILIADDDADPDSLILAGMLFQPNNTQPDLAALLRILRRRLLPPASIC